MSGELAESPIFFYDIAGMPSEPPDAIVEAAKARGVEFVRRPELDAESDKPGAMAYVVVKKALLTIH